MPKKINGFYPHWRDIDLTAWEWPDFHPSELRCGIGTRIDSGPMGEGSCFINRQAMDTLQLARDMADKPFIINSAFRTAPYNASVGGAADSQHLFGMAFDIKLVGHDQTLLVAALKSAGFTGLGFYDTFIHADIGPRRAWDMRT